MKVERANKQLPGKSNSKAINRRSAVAVAIVFVLLAGLIGRLAYLQLVAAEEYRNKAYANYVSEYTIPAHRGSIYDRNMNILAKNVAVENVFVSPRDIADSEELSVIADGLSELLDVDRATIIEACVNNPMSMYQVIKKDLDITTADEVRQFIEEENLSHCVYLEDDSKRVYYYDTLAAHTIGFTNSENEGVYGLEAYYDDVLSGIDGRVIRGRDGLGNDLDIKYDSYIDAVDGSNLVLTIDWTIQSILEKYLQEAYEYNNPHNRAMGVIMDVNNGEILALSVMPSFDLNDPYTLDPRSQELLDSFEETEEKSKAEYKTELLYSMWSNKVISEPYEPGSTFKVITAAIALEEQTSNLDSTYYCSGDGIIVAGVPIKCHLDGGHGVQTFVEALQNSCNPSFVQIVQDIGSSTFLKYVDQFGYFDKSGIDTIGEASTIWHENFNAVELAVSSFGQTFKVTAINHIRALAAVANGGYIVTPHLVKELTDSEGKVIKTFDYDKSRQVISKEVGDKILEILNGGTFTGSTKNVYVEGYNVAAKTGTSQKIDQVDDGEFVPYVSSCIAYAPYEDPQIIILIAIDEPDGPNGEYYGGLIAAPVISKVLSEVLPYMKIPKKSTDTNNTYNIVVEDFTGMGLEEAKEAVSNQNLNYRIVGDGYSIVEQYPAAGETISESGKVVLYTDYTRLDNTIPVPDLYGLSVESAANQLLALGLNIKVSGAYTQGSGAKASSQSVEAGTRVPEGTVVEVEFKYYEGID